MVEAHVIEVGFYGGEMDWINEHFQNSMPVLDGFYTLLTGEWYLSGISSTAFLLHPIPSISQDLGVSKTRSIL